MIILAFIAALLVSVALNFALGCGVAWLLALCFATPFWPVAIVATVVLVLLNR